MNRILLVALLMSSLFLYVELASMKDAVKTLAEAQQRAESVAQTALKNGRELESRQQYEQAFDAYHKARVDPRVSVAAEANAALQTARARQIIDDPRKADPTTTASLLKEIRASGAQNEDLADALELVMRVDETNPAKVLELSKKLAPSDAYGEKMCLFLGKRLLERNQNQTASEVLTRCTASTNTSPELWGFLAEAFRRIGRDEDSLNAMRRSVSTNASPVKRIEFARRLMGDRKWKSALEVLSEVPDGQRLSGEKFRLMGACYYQLNKFQLAAKTYEKAYQAQADPKTLLSKSIAEQSGGMTGKALKTLARLIPSEREVPQVHFQRAQLFAELREVPKATAAFERYLSIAARIQTEASRVRRAQKWLDSRSRMKIREQSNTIQPEPPKKAYIGAPATAPSIEQTK